MGCMLKLAIPLLAAAALLILSAQALYFLSTVIATFARIDLSERYRARIFDLYGKADWLWLVDSRSGEMNFAIMRQVDLASDAHKNAQRVF